MMDYALTMWFTTNKHMGTAAALTEQTASLSFTLNVHTMLEMEQM